VAAAEVVLLSPPGASAYWGALYFQSLMRLAAEGEPGVRFTAVLDCADRPGDVLAAFRQGIADVAFHGAGEVREKLAAIAEARNAHLHPPVVADLDLGTVPDPLASCRQVFQARLC
jgi:hypothetical protein